MQRSNMKVFINIFGSRGDVQPFIVLGKALKEKGHTVMICTDPDLKPRQQKVVLSMAVPRMKPLLFWMQRIPFTRRLIMKKQNARLNNNNGRDNPTA